MSRTKHTAHTAGPWTFNRNTAATHADNCIQAKEGDRSVNIFYLRDSYWAREHNNVPYHAEANAARIVECVNSLEGVQNPAALQSFIREAYKLMLRCDQDEGVQPDGSNMCTLGFAMALENLGVDAVLYDLSK